MEKVRTFLEKNKIVFETIIGSFLTIIGIFVALSANSIINKQTRIEEALSRPIINIEARYENEIINQLKIYSEGSVLSNVSVEVYPYLFVELMNRKTMRENPMTWQQYLPIRYWRSLFDIKRNSTKTGLIATIENSPLLSSFFKQDLIDYFDYNEQNTSNLFLAFISLEYFIRIQYIDALGNEKVEEYQCESGYCNLYYPLANRFDVDPQLRIIAKNSIAADVLSQIDKDKLTNKSDVRWFVGYDAVDQTSRERYDQLMKDLSKAYSEKQLLYE